MKTASSRAPGVAPRGPERSPRRDIAHLAILLVPWALLGWLWWRVGQSTALEQLLVAAGMLLALVAIALPANLAWIGHNVRIFRRKGPRSGRAVVPFDYRADWVGRPVVADWSTVSTARVVVVHSTPDRKVFARDDGSEFTVPAEAASVGALAPAVGTVTPPHGPAVRFAAATSEDAAR